MKYVACTGNNTGKLYIIDASKELATTAPYSGAIDNGIMSMSVVEVSGKAYVVTAAGVSGKGFVRVHTKADDTWKMNSSIGVGNYSIIGDSTPFWGKSVSTSITLRCGYSNYS